MLGQRGDILSLGSLANGAFEGLDTLCGVCSGRGDFAIVPLVRFLLLIAADAGTMVVFIVQLGPIAVGVLGQRGDILGLGSLANGAFEGLDALFGVCSRRGDNTVVPLVCFGDFLLAVLTDLRVVLTVFFCPTSGGEAVAVVVRIQRELESLRGGLDGAFRVRKQRIALGADVVRLRTLYRTGRSCPCNKGESVVALRSLYGNGAVDGIKSNILAFAVDDIAFRIGDAYSVFACCCTFIDGKSDSGKHAAFGVVVKSIRGIRKNIVGTVYIARG